MLFFRSKNKSITNELTKQKLVLTLQRRNKFLLLSKIILFIIVLSASCWALFYYRYQANFNLVVNEFCAPFESYKLATITELQTALNKSQLDYQIESSTRIKLEDEIKNLTKELRDTQLELEFLRGNTQNNSTPARGAAPNQTNRAR